MKVKELEKKIEQWKSELCRISGIQSKTIGHLENELEKAEARLTRLEEAVERRRRVRSELGREAQREGMEWIYLSEADEELYRVADEIKKEV